MKKIFTYVRVSMNLPDSLRASTHRQHLLLGAMQTLLAAYFLRLPQPINALISSGYRTRIESDAIDTNNLIDIISIFDITQRKRHGISPKGKVEDTTPSTRLSKLRIRYPRHYASVRYRISNRFFVFAHPIYDLRTSSFLSLSNS